MSNSIVLGFKTLRGEDAPSVLAGPEVPRLEQFNIVLEAKQKNTFPKGIVKIKFYTLKEEEVAICHKACAEEKAESDKAIAESVKKSKKNAVLLEQKKT